MADGNGNGQIADEIRAATSAVDLPPLSDTQLREAELRAATSMLFDRIQFAQRHGLSFNGARDMYVVLGYAKQLTSAMMGERYARGGIAGRVIDVYPNGTWRGSMTLSEDEDPHETSAFEKAWKTLDQKHQIQSKLLRVDKLSLLSTFAVLLIGAPGLLTDELPRGKPDGSTLRYLSPFLGGGGPGRGGVGRGDFRGTLVSAYDADVSIYELETDAESPRFGLPKSYWLRRSDIASEQSLKPVHWTRVIHVAADRLWDDVYGLPGLERIWNLLDDLEKVTGGGAEAFWLRANQGLHLDIAKDMALPDANLAIAALKEQAEEYKHQLTRWLRTRGVTAETLGSDVANFSSPADAVLTQISGAKGIPKRILTGSEMGELASSQDRENWKDQINGRQTQYAAPYIVRPLVDRLIEYGYLPTPKGGPLAYEVKWPHVQVLTEDEKAAGAQKWAATNQAMGEVVFPNDEIRDHWYGFGPLTAAQKKPPEPPTPAAPALATPKPGPQEAKPDITSKEKPAELAKRAAEEHRANESAMRELEIVLRNAIAAGNNAVINEILGTTLD